TWEKLGLGDSERIARIVVDPTESDTVFVCATGHAYDDHPERGVFRTRDGGAAWEKILHVADDTGCADLVMDPENPRVLYAGMWQFRRQPDFFVSGGPRSGLYKTADGGDTWREVRKGLPERELGRIALAVSLARPERVYATVEAKKTALYRSEDRGESWVRINDSSAVTGRPFYFSRLVADPKNPDRLYKPAFGVTVSDDGGRTFSNLGGGGLFGPSFHGDVHALWVNPENTEQLIIGTDGGTYISLDRGRHWRFVSNLPLSQFYHVSYDMEWPYNVYGGLQDNATWYGPSRRPGPIRNKHWESVTPGDGFWAFVDPTDPDILYAEYQGGRLFRIQKSTGETKDIRPSPKKGEPKYRFNWDTPIHVSRSEAGTIYYGAQFLFRSRDKGDSWERISPDLTTNDPEKQRQDESGGLTPDNSTAENHCTIYAISESPKSGSVIWVGTDDGNLQVTRDGGKTWTNVAGNLPGLPEGTWVSSVEASHFDGATAFATLDGHMTGDVATYVYRTTDYGETWESIAGPDMKWHAHVVKQDLVNPELLFVGTEWGLYLSVDGGKQWAQFKAGLPNVSVRDLAIHPREHDLIIGTHGRGIYILDDLTPLRGLTAEVLASDAAFLDSRPSAMAIPVFEFGFNGDTEFAGRSLGEVAFITYYLRRRHIFGDLKLEIYDSEGNFVTSLPGGKRRGINRVAWPMRSSPPKTAGGAEIIPNFFSFLGPRAPAGRYTVKMIKGKKTYTHELELVPDPRSKHSAEDRALQQKTVHELYGLVERLAFVVASIEGARDQARARAESLPEGDTLREGLAAFAEAMETQRTDLVSTSRGEGISGEEKLREELGVLYGSVNGYEGRPTASQLGRMQILEADLEAAAARFDKAADEELPSLNEALADRKLEPIRKLSEEEWRKR
ncbi:MAG: WD40/YVTN/BNR-like repeat-containing protein, partial [Acidobacteriota bacterium]